MAERLNTEKRNRLEEGWREFVSEDPPFTIRYPDGWQAWQKERMLTIEPPAHDAAITVNAPKTSKSLEEAADMGIEAAFQDAVPVTSREPFMVDGIRGLAQEFERENDNGRKRWLTVFLLGDGRIAVVTANGPEDVILRDRDLYEKIMRSFRFPDKSTVP